MSTKTDLVDHIKNETRVIADLKTCIEANSCRFKDGEIITELRNKNKEQNGSLKRLADQGDENKVTIDKILNIAEGRKSVWKEVAILVTVVSALIAITAIFI